MCVYVRRLPSWGLGEGPATHYRIFSVLTSRLNSVLASGKKSCVFCMVYMFSLRLALGPPQPPIQWVPGALFLGVKLPRRED